MQVERLEVQELADRQIIATLKAAGADVEIPTVGSARADFDSALIAGPTRESSTATFLRELGVA